MTKTSTSKNPRLFYLDWLRVIAFGILVLVNCAEVFASPHWWIANTETNQTIADVLKFFRQWRMPLLFIISGVAVSILLEKRSIIQFIDDRLTRILIPLVSGMIIVVPPMIFFIWRFDGSLEPIQDFYLRLLTPEWFPRGNFHWLHLWYLAFIFIFSIAILPVISLLKTKGGQAVLAAVTIVMSRPAVLFPVILLLHLPYYVTLNFVSSDNITDLLYYIPYFLFGTLFFKQSQIREVFMQNRRAALISGTVTTIILYSFVWLQSDTSAISPGIQRWVEGPLLLPLISLNQWFWVIGLSGLAIRYLNFGSKFLTYANGVVYPLYILHQTIIIALAYYLIPMDASILTKFCLIFTGTFTIILLTYEVLLKRFTILKLMFGIKTDVKLSESFPRSVVYVSKFLPHLSLIKRKSVDPS